MELKCPRCTSSTNELIECDNCQTIGCARCVKKSFGKWICHKCEEKPEIYHSEPEKEDSDVTSAFSAMFD